MSFFYLFFEKVALSRYLATWTVIQKLCEKLLYSKL